MKTILSLPAYKTVIFEIVYTKKISFMKLFGSISLCRKSFGNLFKFEKNASKMQGKIEKNFILFFYPV